MRQNFPRKALLAVIAGLILWFSAGYLLPLCFPFLLGGVLAGTAEPTTRLLCEKGHLPRALAAVVSVSGVCLLGTAAIGLLLALLARQVHNLGSILPQAEAAVSEGLLTLKTKLTAMVGRLPGSAGQKIPALVESLFSDNTSLLRSAMEALPKLAGNTLSSLSKGLFGIITGILSGYMLAARLPGLKSWVLQRLPDSWQQKYRPLLLDLRKALGGWVQAEVKLALVAFGLLMAGFWLLRVEHAVTIAGLVTIVDAFPVLGVGTVLVPWAAVCLLQGQIARGVGLMGLFAVIWLVRSVLEPKLVGKSIGLDPLLTLAAIYIGFRLWGVAGMLLAPILALMTAQTVKQLQR